MSTTTTPTVLPGQEALPGTGVESAPVAPAARKPAPRSVIKIPQAAFKERVRRDANALVRAELGMDMDDLRERLATLDKVQASSGDRTAEEAAEVQQLRKDIAKLSKSAAESAKAAQDWEQKHRKDTRRLRDRQIEADLRFRAAQAGLSDPEYALHLFAREAASGQASDPDEFFAGLQDAPWNRTAAPAPVAVETPVVAAAPPQPETVELTPTTAPPESRAPGEERPEPAGIATAPRSADVEKMSSQEFARHSRANYGFTPGA